MSFFIPAKVRHDLTGRYLWGEFTDHPEQVYLHKGDTVLVDPTSINEIDAFAYWQGAFSATIGVDELDMSEEQHG